MNTLINFTVQFENLKESLIYIVKLLTTHNNKINIQQHNIDDNKMIITDLEEQMSDNEELLSWMAKWKVN
jgi:hypothetical protein